VRFYTGTHRASWLERVDVPLFISRRTMPKRKLPRALGPWALDSAAFSELSLYGRWETTPWTYAAEVRRFRDEVGGLAWAAIQDWMVEPFILAKTGLTIEDHQRRTIGSYISLRSRSPEIPWAPVLQGWTRGDYLRHVDAYEAAGVELRALPVVGVGSVCRRQNETSALLLFEELRRVGLANLHGFGLKVSGLTGLVELARTMGTPAALASADSLAWSYQARRERPLPGCEGHKNCANCLAFALDWRERLLESIERAGRAPRTAELFAEAVAC